MFVVERRREAFDLLHCPLIILLELPNDRSQVFNFPFSPHPILLKLPDRRIEVLYFPCSPTIVFTQSIHLPRA